MLNKLQIKKTGKRDNISVFPMDGYFDVLKGYVIFDLHYEE